MADIESAYVEKDQMQSATLRDEYLQVFLGCLCILTGTSHLKISRFDVIKAFYVLNPETNEVRHHDTLKPFHIHGVIKDSNSIFSMSPCLSFL